MQPSNQTLHPSTGQPSVTLLSMWVYMNLDREMKIWKSTERLFCLKKKPLNKINLVYLFFCETSKFHALSKIKLKSEHLKFRKKKHNYIPIDDSETSLELKKGLKNQGKN